MIFDQKYPSHLQAYKDVHKETFAALMDLYENNFLRLKKLIPHLKTIDGEKISMVFGCLTLHLKVLEQSRFTTLLSLSYIFERDEKSAREPDLLIRIYHDVGLAEVLSGQLHHGCLNLSNVPATAIMERWHLNRFLYKWLGFLLHIGHAFESSSDPKSIKTKINCILSEKI